MDSYHYIWEKLKKVYPDIEPKCMSTVMKFADGGTNPLDTIAIFPVKKPLHWHWITFGFQQIQSIDWEGDGELSCELSLRVSRTDIEKEAPEWGSELLRKLSGYVMNTGCGFDSEHYIQWGGSIDGGSSNLKAIIFRDDPELGTVDIPHGRIKFLTPIGITSDEHEYAKVNGPEKLLTLISEKNPLGMIVLKRKSIL